MSFSIKTRLGTYLGTTYTREQLRVASAKPGFELHEVPNAYFETIDKEGNRHFYYLNLRRGRMTEDGAPIPSPTRRSGRAEEFEQAVEELKMLVEEAGMTLVNPNELTGRFILAVTPRDRNRYVGNVITGKATDRGYGIRGVLSARLEIRAGLKEDFDEGLTYCYRGTMKMRVKRNKTEELFIIVKPHVKAVMEDLHTPASVINEWVIEWMSENFPFLFDHELVSDFTMQRESKLS